MTKTHSPVSVLLFDLFQTQGIRRVTSPAPLQASLSLFASMCVFLGRADCDNEEGEESGFCELDLKVLMEIILKKSGD